MLVVNAAKTINGYLTDQYVWNDGSGMPRSVALVRTDPKGGHAKQFTYQLPDGTQLLVNESPPPVDSATSYPTSGTRRLPVGTVKTILPWARV